MSTQTNIANVVATLASRQGENASARKLTGPERAAVLMLALGEQHGAKVWTLLDDDELRQLSIIMSTIGTVESSSVENLLLEFVSRMSASGALLGNYDATERLLQQYLPPERVGGMMAEIFNSFDRQTETRFMTALEEDNREAAERIKNLMFTFDDLVKLDAGSAQTLMRHVDKDKLAIALKGATEPVRQFFLGNMSSRAAKMLGDDMGAMGPVRLRDVDDAQGQLVSLAKDLAAKGEIMISKSRGDEELVY